ncbi:XdhC family protein [Williamsia sp. CHRR-6]|uniref:XdhC family protein n=1 Tax=Williamsia sp. CHRR-6 TaxID=2835871 RepID=UPI001BDA0252|nr:XdhC/CoxI family protein [Williamsia sp. CHRR-6]MBT0566912.1 XdhC family protein [Williamsia sp. CHRR-6]
MRDVLDALIDVTDRGPAVLARVIATTGSSPRAVGSAMVIGSDGCVHGSLSGGCVEAEVLAVAVEVFADGATRIERFASVAADPLAVGLPCGGEIDVMIERVDDAAEFTRLRAHIAAGVGCALLTTTSAEVAQRVAIDADTESLSPPFDRMVGDARALLAAGTNAVLGAEVNACRAEVFVQTFAAAPRMILAGANDFVRALLDVGVLLGYRVSVVDARATFVSPARFPTAHDAVVDWPDRYLAREHAAGRLDARTVICVMTHDDKFDVPALQAALTLDRFAFVGAMGSRRTTADRVQRLVDGGIAPADLARLVAPVGLDIDAHTPAETAISIAAQVIAARSAADGGALSDRSGPIHRAV